jgi:PadR family transcriptional regulator AphA
MAGIVSVRHFVLGLLAQQSLSGYDIKRFLRSLSWLIDVPSFGSLYPALHALLKDSLVTVEVIPNQDRPPRKIYTITDAGRRALQEWMRQPDPPNTSLRAFVLRLTLAGHFSDDGLRAHLERRHKQVVNFHHALEQAAGTLNEDMSLGERLTLDYGLALAKAELAWLDRTLARLSQPSLPVEVAESAQGSLVTVTA